jgi:tetratricopeptide (TPR) repeat protein
VRSEVRGPRSEPFTPSLSRGVLFFVLLALPAFAAEEPLAAGLRARLQAIDQNLQDWDLEGAKRELEEVKKVAPDVESLQYWDARIAFEEGRYDEAVKLLERSGVDDKPGSYLRLAKDTLRVTKDDEVQESEHFILRYPKGKDAVLVSYALETLEAQRAALAQDLGHAPQGKVRVEVLNDATELSMLSTLSKEQIRATGTIAICKFNKLMVTSPRAVIRGYDWRDTLAHEYVHYVVGQKSKNTVPIWMHEGLAKYLESRWRGPPGLAMTPSTQALLGNRLRKNTLISFEKMHPSIAMLPTAEDAATAFAEVFYAMDLLHQTSGAAAFRTLIHERAGGKSDQAAVEAAYGKSFGAFEKAWQAHMRKQPFPKELIPPDSSTKKQLASDSPGRAKEAEKKKKRDISFGDFIEVEEPDARKSAHLGELMRERGHVAAAAEQYGKAWAKVKDRYESVSNKYALALIELKRLDEAKSVLEGSLTMHPGSGPTNVHLGRLALRKGDWGSAKKAYLSALDVNPFDPEIHVSLLRVYSQLGDRKGLERARKDAALLLGEDEKAVEELARTLGRDESLVDPLPATPEPDAGTPPAAPAAVDAGKPSGDVFKSIKVKVTKDAGH